MPVQIKQSPLTPNTLQQLEQVLRDVPDQRERLDAAVDEQGLRLFQAIFNGRTVGLLLLRQADTRPEVDTVVVHPATRGRGVGRTLLEHARQTLGTEPVMPAQCQRGE